jgi:hypothetical protein
MTVVMKNQRKGKVLNHPPVSSQVRQKLQAFFNKEYITFSGGLIMTSFGRVYNTRDDSGKKIK